MQRNEKCIECILPMGETFNVKRWGLNDSVRWLNNVNAVLWCWCLSVQVIVSSSEGITALHSHTPPELHRPSLLQSVDVTKLKSQVHELNRPFADVASKKRGLYREPFCDGEFALLLSSRFFSHWSQSNATAMHWMRATSVPNTTR